VDALTDWRAGCDVSVGSPSSAGRIRKGQQTDLRRAAVLTSLSDEHRLDAVEQIIPLAEAAGCR
jgi:hypothetical protein